MKKILITCMCFFILYTVLKNDKEVNVVVSNTVQELKSHISKSTEPTKSTEISGNFLEKSVSQILVNILKTDDGKIFLEKLIQPMNKPLAAGNIGYKINNDTILTSIFNIDSSLKHLQNGKKTTDNNIKAICGQSVLINYKIFASENTIPEEGKKEIVLGKNSILLGLDAIITNMQINETRDATIPTHTLLQLFEDSSENTEIILKNQKTIFQTKVNVTLLAINSPNITTSDIKIFDDEISYNMPFFCGYPKKITFNTKITRLSDNVIIVNNKKISMNIGNRDYPAIFSYALHNKIATGTRTIIAKGAALKSIENENNKLPETANLQDEDYFMIELSNFIQ